MLGISHVLAHLILLTSTKIIAVQGDCSCPDERDCHPVKSRPSKEIFIFSVSNKNWRLYDWNKVTTVVEFGYHDPDLVCFAHSKGKKVVTNVSFPSANLTDSNMRSKWVKEKVAFAKKKHLDGINVDTEDAIPAHATDMRDGLTALMKELRIALGQDALLTFDVAWSPACIDQRCYDYKALAEICDLLFVMSYDERSQIYYECIAWANSAINSTKHGVMEYLKMGISEEKLVLGVPWYGYDYPCLRLTQDHKCYIKKIPFRGVDCSDAAGRQISYPSIMTSFMPKATHVGWDSIAQSPYFDYKDEKSGMMHQMWYDNIKSLKEKYSLALDLKLRGVGMWNAEYVDYSNTTAGAKMRQEMWGALPDY